MPYAARKAAVSKSDPPLIEPNVLSSLESSLNLTEESDDAGAVAATAEEEEADEEDLLFLLFHCASCTFLS